MKKFFLFGIMLPGFTAAQTLLPGDFVSNCADALGWLVTKMSFNSDSTFTSLTEGDITHSSSKGFFRLKKDTIILSYKPDTVIMPGSFSVDTSGDKLKLDTFIIPPQQQRIWLYRLLMVDQSTLYVLDGEGKIYKGSCLTQKEYFLRRDPDFHIELPLPILKERNPETIKKEPQVSLSPLKHEEVSDTFKTIYFKSWGTIKWGVDSIYKTCEDSLQNKFGFTYVHVAGSLVTPEQGKAWGKHNRKMERQMNKRQGKGWRERYTKELDACINNLNQY